MEELINKSGDKQQIELFTALLAHDLKNPLSAQLALLEQLHKGKFGGINFVQSEVLNEIINSYKFMTEMLSSLLYAHKLDNGTIKINKTQVKLDELIITCIKEITALADEKCILIEFINKMQTELLFCGENYIRRVISNMLNNIVLYSYKNSKAYVILEEDTTFASIRFKSSGIPVKDDLKAHIFDKYNTGFHHNAGTGLGLYFCRRAIEAHGGTIALNQHNSDIEFIILLPKSSPDNAVLKFN